MALVSKREAYRRIRAVLAKPKKLRSVDVICDLEQLFALLEVKDITNGIRRITKTVNIDSVPDRQLLCLLAEYCIEKKLDNEQAIMEYAEFIKLRN